MNYVMALSSPHSSAPPIPTSGDVRSASYIGKARVRAERDATSAAWEEAAAAAEDERMQVQLQLEQERLEHAATRDALNKCEQRLAHVEVSMAAYREAVESRTDAEQQQLMQKIAAAEARAEARTKVHTTRAVVAERDVASLSAQALIDSVHRTTQARELALLDGTVGFMDAKLGSMRRELHASLELQQALERDAEVARRASDVASLEVAHLHHVVAAQKHSLDDVRHQLEGAQAWAREAEATFEETLVGIRQAAAEQLTVQSKRLKAWEEKLPLPTHLVGTTAAIGLPGKDLTARGVSKEVSELVEAERSLMADQARLFTDATGSSAMWEARLLREKVRHAETELDAAQHAEKDLAADLQAVAAREHAAALHAVTSELGATRKRLAEAEEAMARMEEWAHTQVALSRTTFEEAKCTLLDHAAAMSATEADALAAASKSDGSLITAGAIDAHSWGEQSAAHGHDAEILANLNQHKASGASSSGQRQHADSAPIDGADGGMGGRRSGRSSSSGGAEAGGSAEVTRLRARLLEAEETLAAKMEEAATAATRTADKHRRDLTQAQRWGAQLEAKLEQTAAALELEREEHARLDGALADAQAKLMDVEAQVQRAAASPIARRHSAHRSATTSAVVASVNAAEPTGAAAGHAPTTPKRRVARARAVAALPIRPTASIDSGTAALRVGGLSRPEDIDLRPQASHGSQGQGAVSAAAAASPSCVTSTAATSSCPPRRTPTFSAATTTHTCSSPARRGRVV